MWQALRHGGLAAIIHDDVSHIEERGPYSFRPARAVSDARIAKTIKKA
jgi:hypothetical protein